MCRPKHVEQLRNTGIINSTTRSHLVGSFYEVYITMHGSMNIKLARFVPFCRAVRSQLQQGIRNRKAVKCTPTWPVHPNNWHNEADIVTLGIMR